MSANQANADAAISPSSFNEVEKLVHQLYEPVTPHQVSEIQDSLQKLQRSEHGWRLADALLQSQDEKGHSAARGRPTTLA
ncbi:MAG: hypothetical protein Q9201_002565 [Fulgogasparrea decipioides]